MIDMQQERATVERRFQQDMEHIAKHEGAAAALNHLEPLLTFLGDRVEVRYSTVWPAIVVEIQLRDDETFKSFGWLMEGMVRAGFEPGVTYEIGKERQYPFLRSGVRVRLHLYGGTKCELVQTGVQTVPVYKLVCQDESQRMDDNRESDTMP